MSSNNNIHLKVRFPQKRVVTGIMTAGRNNSVYLQYTTGYKLNYSADADCVEWLPVRDSTRQEMVSRVNVCVYHVLNPVLKTILESVV